MRPAIVIIGGGISGLTAGIALARRGLAPVIYEQAPELEEVGAGVTLWANAFRALEAIGLAGEVLALAGGFTGGGVKRRDGTWLMHQRKDIMLGRWGSALASTHRAELQQLLAAEIDPAGIHLGARCTGFRYTARGVAAQFEDGREAQADLLVAADGVHSVIRGQLFGDAPLRYRGYTAIRGITPAGSVPLPADASETWGRGCRFGLGPTSGDRLTWFATWNAPPGSGVGGGRERLLRLFGDWHEPIRHVIEATPPDGIVQTDIYDRRPARTWTRGRIALIGDAIHPMTPDLGQGACQGIVDAVTLAGCVAATGDLRAALLSYQRQRRRNAAITTMIARTMASTGQRHGRYSCAARDAMITALPLPVLLRQLDLVIGRPQARPAGHRRAD
jgi:2-polyprenyl-6-methoxyphenol hydroxylase-like FAD-dependent oxidoreductase